MSEIGSSVERLTPLTSGESRPGRPGLALRLALRELRAGLGGFYVFIACVALGVAVITTVGVLSNALTSGLEQQGERILGGDVTLTRVHKRADPAERAWLEARGTLSESLTMRTMARTLDGQEQTLVELKGVDAAFPLVGSVTLQAGGTLEEAVRGQSGGAAVDPIILERLGLRLGDRITLGRATVPITALIVSEPDAVTDRQTFGPRVLVSLATLERTDLVQPGTLLRWRYALRLPADKRQADDLVAFRRATESGLPQAGFSLADRRDPSPQITRTLVRLRQFLTLIGLTALMIGGVGVSNAVATFIDKRRRTIAIMKSVGGTSRTIFSIFLAQVLLIAAIGIVIGVVVGHAVPIVVNAVWGGVLPIPAEVRLDVAGFAPAVLYGLLVSLLFALWPLGRSEQVPAAMLFREDVAPSRVLPRWQIIAATVAVGGVLLALAVIGAESQRLALYFSLGLAVVFALFTGLGHLVAILARRLPRPRRPELALALGNIGGPGNLSQSAVLSLGVGLTLLVAVGLVDTAIEDELTSRRPKESPNYFVLDIGKSEMSEFEQIVHRVAPQARIGQAPMLRGRLVKLKDRPVEQISAPPEASWVLTGDRGLSYSVEVPDGSRVVKGDWWPADYEGEPLVSFEADLARHLGLGIGDTVTVNVLGRNVTARVASLREVKWESLAINFVMVFSPNTLKAAPHKILATITLPDDAPLAVEADIARQIGRALPTVTAIRVKDAIASFNGIFNKVMTAIRVAGSVTLIAGALVLAGALATAQRRRIGQAVVLKAIGATRRRVVAAHLAEYVALAVATAGIAVVLGAVAAWIVVTRVMEIPFVPSVTTVAEAVGFSVGLMLLFGGFGTWTVLSAPTVPHLRTE